MEFLVGMMGPYAGQIVGLKFQADGLAVDLLLALRPPGSVHPFRVAQQPLDVVADLVCDHIRAREFSRRAEFVLQDSVEGQVDVDLAVFWTVEGTDSGIRR